MNGRDEIAFGPAARARSTMPTQSKFSALFDAWGNAEVNVRAVVESKMLTAASGRSLECDRDILSDIDARLWGGPWVAAAKSATWLTARATSAKHLLKDVFELRRVNLLARPCAGATSGCPARPVSRACAAARRAHLTKAVKGSPLFSIGEDFVCLLDLGEFLVSISLGADIGVVGPCEFAIG
jgi:hypothetical protein